MYETVAIIDYGMGNLGSVAKAFERAGAVVRVTSDAKDLRQASRLVLPGVGAFPEGIANLKKLGLVDEIYRLVLNERKPLLGICLGMQLLASRGEEGGFFSGLNLISGTVKKFDIDPALKVPHMGWNDVSVVAKNNCPLFGGLGEDRAFYFVHSYHLACDHEAMVAATCDYGGDFAAAVWRENIYGIQFHPEKSQANGLKILSNFLSC